MKAPSPSRHRSRRGAQAIEFALILPVFLVVMAAAFEYGLVVHMRATATAAAWTGCRAGAAVSPDDSSTPAEVAELAIQDRLADFHPFGMSCDGSDSRCEISVITSGADPSERLQCELTMEFPGLTGAVLVPESIHGSATTVLEYQG